MSLLDVAVSVLLLAGVSVMMLAAFGLLRFGDVFLRMHAATKSNTLGIGLVMTAVALYFGDSLITLKLLALLTIYFLTTATGAQSLAQAAHLARIPMVKEAWIDELAVDEERAESGASEGSATARGNAAEEATPV